MTVMKKTEQKDDAVSPVVGVMLMLVVTIIIAAVVAAFAGGLATSTEKAPTAVLDVQIYSSHDIAGSMGALFNGGGYAPDFTVTHLSGEPINTADTKFLFSWENATSGQLYYFEYSGGEEPISCNGYELPGALYANDGDLTDEDVFGKVVLTPGMQMQSGSQYLKVNWGGGTIAKHTGSPCMDEIFKAKNGEYEVATKDSNEIYSGGVMNILPKGTAVSVQLLHVPSGQLIYDKEVFVL